MTESFALMNIRDMHFDEGDGNRGKRISQCDAGVSQAAGIDHNCVHTLGFGSLDAVNQDTFMIALEANQHCASFDSLRRGGILDICQRICSVDFRFTSAEQIQVRAIQQEDILCHRDTTPFDDDGRTLPLNDVEWQEENLSIMLRAE